VAIYSNDMGQDPEWAASICSAECNCDRTPQLAQRECAPRPPAWPEIESAACLTMTL